MKETQVNLISMAKPNGSYWTIGFTRDSEIVAAFLRKNSEDRFQEIARKCGVVSCFRVVAVYDHGEFKKFSDRVENEVTYRGQLERGVIKEDD